MDPIKQFLNCGGGSKQQNNNNSDQQQQSRPSSGQRSATSRPSVPLELDAHYAQYSWSDWVPNVSQLNNSNNTATIRRYGDYGAAVPRVSGRRYSVQSPSSRSSSSSTFQASQPEASSSGSWSSRNLPSKQAASAVAAKPAAAAAATATKATAITDVAPQMLDSTIYGFRRTSTLSDNELTIPRTISQAEIQVAFSLIDVNHDGLIDVRELRHMLANLGIAINDETLGKIMAMASKRGDSLISEEEFLDWISHFIQLTDNEQQQQQQQQQKQKQEQQKPQQRTTAERLKSLGSSFGTRRKYRDQSPSRAPQMPTAALTLGSPPTSAEAKATAKQLAHHPPLATRSSSVSSFPPSLSSISSPSSSSSSSSTSYKPSSSMSSSSSATNPSRASSTSSSSAADNQTTKSSASNPSAGDLTNQNDAESDVRAAFKVFDVDNNGFITPNEIRLGLKLIGEELTDHELRNLLKDTRTTVEGKISIDEFVRLIM